MIMPVSWGIETCCFYQVECFIAPLLIRRSLSLLPLSAILAAMISRLVL